MNGLFRRDKAVLIVNSLLMNAGVERRTLDFARFLRGRNLDVEVCVLREVGKVAPIFAAAGIPVRHIRVYEYDAQGRYTFFPAAYLRLVLHLIRGRFGLVFCVQPPSYIFGRLASFPPLGRRIVAMERFLIGVRSKRRLWFDRQMARWSRVVCVSTLLRDDLAAAARIPEGEISVIEDGVAITPPSNPQTELREKLAGRFTFGCVGLLTRRKRQALLIQALASVIKAGHAGTPPALVLVGGGEDEEELKALVKKMNLECDVLFAGEQTNPHDFYPLFHAFIFPSVGEGLGNVWAEAMLHGLPVICANIRPMSDYIRHNENGLLTPPDDADALAAEMRRLMDSAALRAGLGEQGRLYAEEHFAADRQMQKLLDAALVR